jgi:hypothetical protein
MTQSERIRREGFNDFKRGSDITANPYKRGTTEWTLYREGWADASYQTWQGVLMDKRKASTE